jgi:tetratricopeptide (TPR) repeat protein/tRNA A-37 threonylcarbamoyl transferase component Bud32
MNPGELLRNRYRIEKALAAGGFGETYLAIDLDYPGQRQVVVKQLKPAQSDPATLEIARRLFESEAQVLADLGETSDRLPALYAYFEEQGEFYLVQEFIAGQTLTMDLAGRQLSESQTIEILREILASLQVVHGKNKIHRDLKPDNIVRRTQDSKLVLIDFGAVKELRQATNLGQTASIGIGTSGYMPTEQAIGFPKLASDVYAVGAIGIQCLTGVEPHKLFDEDALVLRWQHLCQVSSSLAAVLEKMVAQQVSSRYRDGMEAAEAIDSLSIAPPPAVTVIPKPSPTVPPVATQTPATISGLFDFDRHKFLKFLMIGGAGLFGIFLLGNVFSLKNSIINNSSIDTSSLPSSTTSPSTAKNNGSSDTNNLNDQNLTKSESESKKKEIAGYDKAIAINSQNIDAYLKRGIAKFKLGNKQEAMDDFNKAVSLDRKNAKAYGVRGAAKFVSGNKQEAIADFDQAISLDSKYAQAYALRGLAKYDLGNKQEATVDYNKAISLDPKNTDAYINRGLAKSDLGNKKEAIADYNKAISIDPKNSWAYTNRGNAKSDLGNKKEAIADYDKAISIDPKYAQAYAFRGLAKYDLGNKQEAIADYDKAISIDPKNSWVYSNRGDAKSDSGNKKEAIADYDKAISIDSKNASAYNGRGVVKYSLGDLSGSLADYEQAIAIDPKLAGSHSNIAFIKYDLNDIPSAINSWRKSLELSPNEPDTQLGLAVALYRQGESAEAFQLAKAAISKEKRSTDLEFLRKDRFWSEKIIKDANEFFQALSTNGN